MYYEIHILIICDHYEYDVEKNCTVNFVALKEKHVFFTNLCD
jgi:hypothetical protein